MANKGNALSAGNCLAAGDYLVAPNGQYFFILQGDGNCCLYRGSSPEDNRGLLWGAVQAVGYPTSEGNHFLIMQGDGNLCCYRGVLEGPHDFLWGSVDVCGYAPAPGEYTASLDDDGRLRIKTSLQAIATLNRNTLAAGAFLAVNEFLVASNGQYFAYLQPDGNFCIYRGPGPSKNQAFVWGSSQALGHSLPDGDYFVTMQGDGNFCCYRGTGPSDPQGFVWGSAGLRNYQTEAGQYLAFLGGDGTLSILADRGASLTRFSQLNGKAIPTVSSDQMQLTITSKFMDDIADAVPILDSQGLEQVYAAKNGDINIYSPAGFVKGKAGSVRRVYATAQAPSGWETEFLPVPSVVADATAAILPTVVIVPGQQDRLLVYQDFSIQIGSLDNTGRYFALNSISKGPSVPMVAGCVASGCRYLPEKEYDLAGGIAKRIVLRDVNDPTLTAFGVKDGVFSTGPNGTQSVFPLSPTDGVNPFIVVDGNGAIRYLKLSLNDGIFEAAQDLAVGNTQSGCVDVQVTPEGHIFIWIAELPKVLLVFGERHPVTGVIQWSGGPLEKGPTFPDISTASSYRLRTLVDWTARKAQHWLSVQPGEGSAPEIWTSAGSFSGPSYSAPVRLACGVRFVDLIPGTSRFLSVRGGSGYEICTPAPPTEEIIHSPTPDQMTGAVSVQFLGGDTYKIFRAAPLGECTCQAVRVPNADRLLSASYRVGITVTKSGMPLAGQSIRVKATATALVVFQGQWLVMSPMKSLVGETGMDGTAWLSVVSPSSLSFPTLRVSCHGCAQDFEVDLHSEISSFLAGVTADQLAAARDPRTGARVLSPNNASAAAQAIQQFAQMAPAPPANRAVAADSGVLVDSSLPFRWVARDAALVRQPAMATASAWRLAASNGSLQFQTVAGSTAMPAGGRNLSVLDWISDGIDWFIGEFEQLVELVVDGAKATLKLVIDGAQQTFNFIVDTAEAVLRVIDVILRAAGGMAGAAVGWVLDHLGFLFDWGAIKAIRNEFRDLVRAGAADLPNRVADPGPAIRDLVDHVRSAEASVIGAIRRFQFQFPSGKGNFGELTRYATTLAKLATTGGGDSYLPQSSWLLDKLSGPLSKFALQPPTPLAGPIDDAIGKFGEVLATMNESFTSLIEGLANQTAQWLTDPESALQGDFNVLLDFLAKWLHELFSAIEQLVLSLGTVLHEIWKMATQPIDWLDIHLDIPYVAEYYRGVTGNDFSLFDMACMSAAIAAYAMGYRPGQGAPAPGMVRSAAAGKGSRDSQTANACLAFRICNVITTALSSGITAGTSPSQEGRLVKAGFALTGLDIAFSFSALMLNTSLPDFDGQTLDVFAGVVAVLMVCNDTGGLTWVRQHLNEALTVVQVVLCGFNGYLTVKGFEDSDLNKALIGLTRVIQNGLNIAMRIKRRQGAMDYRKAIAFGLLQGGLSSVRVYIFWKQPV